MENEPIVKKKKRKKKVECSLRINYRPLFCAQSCIYLALVDSNGEQQTL